MHIKSWTTYYCRLLHKEFTVALQSTAVLALFMGTSDAATTVAPLISLSQALEQIAFRPLLTAAFAQARRDIAYPSTIEHISRYSPYIGTAGFLMLYDAEFSPKGNDAFIFSIDGAFPNVQLTKAGNYLFTETFIKEREHPNSNLIELCFMGTIKGKKKFIAWSIASYRHLKAQEIEGFPSEAIIHNLLQLLPDPLVFEYLSNQPKGVGSHFAYQIASKEFDSALKNYASKYSAAPLSTLQTRYIQLLCNYTIDLYMRIPQFFSMKAPFEPITSITRGKSIFEATSRYPRLAPYVDQCRNLFRATCTYFSTNTKGRYLNIIEQQSFSPSSDKKWYMGFDSSSLAIMGPQSYELSYDPMTAYSVGWEEEAESPYILSGDLSRGLSIVQNRKGTWEEKLLCPADRLKKLYAETSNIEKSMYAQSSDKLLVSWCIKIPRHDAYFIVLGTDRTEPNMFEQKMETRAIEFQFFFIWKMRNTFVVERVDTLLPACWSSLTCALDGSALYLVNVEKSGIIYIDLKTLFSELSKL